MEGPPPDDVDETDIWDALGRSWGLVVDQPRYVPKGFGSYHWLAETRTGEQHFLTVDDLDTKPWLGADRETAFDGLRTAYETAVILHESARLGFVVAPLPTRTAEIIVRLAPRYSLSVFPFVVGKAGKWGEPVGQQDRASLLRLIADLHMSTPAVASLARRGEVELPGRASLETALADLDRQWTGGPFSEPARLTLAAHADAVREALTSFDTFAAHVMGANPVSVVTHGEPHPGNLISTPGGFALVDWDTAALAPPERDLWMLDDGDTGLAPYSEMTGRTIDHTAIALYQLVWTLADIAAFTALFRSAHTRNDDTEKAMRSLATSSHLSAPQPYGSPGPVTGGA